MKCNLCGDSKIFFTIMPEISDWIGWGSHVVVENNDKCCLYHYQCGGVDVMSVYEMFVALYPKPPEEK